VAPLMPSWGVDQARDDGVPAEVGDNRIGPGPCPHRLLGADC
jgi:hypothetical protein